MVTRLSLPRATPRRNTLAATRCEHVFGLQCTLKPHDLASGGWRRSLTTSGRGLSRTDQEAQTGGGGGKKGRLPKTEKAASGSKGSGTGGDDEKTKARPGTNKHPA